MRHKAKLGTLTIANGQTASNILAGRELAFCVGLLFINPSAFTGAVTLQSAPDEASAAAAMKAVSVGGADVTLTAGKVQSVGLPGGIGEAIRVLSGAAEAAQRDIEVYAILEMHE
jgi:hypothetical protein